MSFSIIPLLLVFSAASFANTADLRDSKALYALWAKIKAPLSVKKSESIGAYSAGCVSGAQSLPLNGKGYSVMRPSRLRYFGHPELLAFIRGLGEKANKAKMPYVLVGDLGRPRGGPTVSGHFSHQTGLDVDIWFRLSAKRPTKRQREKWWAPAYVGKGNKLSSKWKASHRRLLKLAASDERVARIFVNAAIKRDLCQKYPHAPWLYKVRAWWGHADHFHVRLKCPKGSVACAAQDPLDPQEPQCGETLAWWFSPEAETDGKAKSKQIAEREFPELPKECDAMVSGLEKRERHAERSH